MSFCGIKLMSKLVGLFSKFNEFYNT